MTKTACAHVAVGKSHIDQRGLNSRVAEVYASITEIVWYCESCCRAKNKEKDATQVKLFLRYVDDIVRTVRGEPSCLLDAANSLHPNLQFTLEKTNSEGILPSWI